MDREQVLTCPWEEMGFPKFAHDFRKPLSGIVSLCFLLSTVDTSALPAEAQDWLAEIQKLSQQGLAETDTLLGYLETLSETPLVT